MAESASNRSTHGARIDPLILANVPPTPGQRRTAAAFALALLAIFLATLPYATLRLPEIDAFVPSLAAALFVADGVAATLLFAQFSILRQWALLALANGYLLSALIVVAHALAFPGAFAPTGLMGAGIQSAVWLYWIWHSALPLAVIVYALLMDSDRAIDAGYTRLAIGVSMIAAPALVAGCFWFVTQHQDLLPVTFVDVKPISLFRQFVGGAMVLSEGVVALCLLWLRRRYLLDQWLMVALFALVLEVLLASVLSTGRFTFAWYGGRFYQFVTATVVMVVLLTEMSRLYTRVASLNTMLRRERDNKLMNLEAMAASISHEVGQPLAAISMRGGVALRVLAREPLDLERVRSNLTTMVSESHRASQVFDNIRALFTSTDREQAAIDINEIALGALGILNGDLEEHNITASTELARDLPLVTGHRGQLQEVFLNLFRNAIEAMDAVKDGSRLLHVKTGHHGGDAVAVAIEDSGPGINSEKLSAIFDPFVTTKPRGMGLGLAICRMTIERHGGQLSASSGDNSAGRNQGARFQFTLPTKPAARPAPSMV